MEPVVLVEAMGAALLALLLGAILGCVVALWCGVAWVRGRPVHAGVPALAVALPLVAALGGAALRLGGLEVDATRALGGALGFRLLAPLFVVPPALLLGAFGAAYGWRAAPRRWRALALGAACVGATAGVTVLGGVVEEDLVFPVVRALCTLVVGTGLALALLRGGAPAAGLGAVFALVVAALESSALALERVFLLIGLQALERDLWAAYVPEAWGFVVAPMAVWHHAAVGLGVFTAVVALWLARVDGAGPSRSQVVAVVAWGGLALVVPWVGSPGRATLETYAVAPLPVAPSPPSVDHDAPTPGDSPPR